MSSMRSAGRGRLPVCVVRTRLLLRFIFFSSDAIVGCQNTAAMLLCQLVARPLPRRLIDRLLCDTLPPARRPRGAVGLIQNACPHRGASLFFGRNEKEGLRCVYHGWKFDCSGQCVDMPSEPAESNFKSKIKATAYPCHERHGVIWTYMGSRETPPALPELPPNLDPECRAIRRLEQGSYM